MEQIPIPTLESAVSLSELSMRRPGWTPSIVPNGQDQNMYLVVDRIGHDDVIFHEVPIGRTELEIVIKDLLQGQYDDPLRVVSFNTEEKWAQDVSEDVAREIQPRCDLALEDVPHFLEDFVAKYLGHRDRQLALRLA